MSRSVTRLLIDASVGVALASAVAGTVAWDRRNTPGRGAGPPKAAAEPSLLARADTPVPVIAPVEAGREVGPKEAPRDTPGTVVAAKVEPAAAPPPTGATGPAPAPDRSPPTDFVAEIPASLRDAHSIYDARTADHRSQWIGSLGGSPESEAAVAAGLEWLARHQGRDGMWGDVCLGGGPESVCDRRRPCGGAGGHYPFAQTGLALLALQAGGHYAFNGRPYSRHVRRGLDSLVSPRTEPGASMQPMYEHGIATFALAEACALARASGRKPDPEYVTAMREAIALIERAQHADGGWRYSPAPTGGSDTSVTGWQVLALKSAREAGVAVPRDCLAGVRRYFLSCESQDGRTSYTPGGGYGSNAMTGVGMLAHEVLLGTREDSLVQRGAASLAGGLGRRPSLPDYYELYNCSLALYLADGPSGPLWTRWNEALRDRLIAAQLPPDSGCERGSWPPARGHDSQGGRVYTTALAVLTLEVYYRFAPVKK